MPFLDEMRALKSRQAIIGRSDSRNIGIFGRSIKQL